jgi:hypothetical protein
LSEQQAASGGRPSEEEMRARLEEELKKIKVRDVLLQTAVTLINLGGQRLGLTEQTSEARDLAQARTAIEAVRALLPLLEEEGTEELRPLRDALAQLQMAYAHEADVGEQSSGAERKDRAASAADAQREEEPSERPPGPKRSGRLWVPPGTTT